MARVGSADAVVGDLDVDGAGARRHADLRMFLESGGNPFYLEQLARMLQTQPSLPPAAARPAEELPGVPHAVASALAEELRGLPPVSRVVLDAAAVSGAEFDPAAVAAIAELDERAALDALDALTDAGLVRALPGTRRFSLRHPIIRRAVYDSSGAGWRLAAHQRAAAALRADGAAPEAYAHHLVGAPPGRATSRPRPNWSPPRRPSAPGRPHRPRAGSARRSSSSSAAAPARAPAASRRARGRPGRLRPHRRGARRARARARHAAEPRGRPRRCR